MEAVKEAIQSLFRSFSNAIIQSIEKIPQSGGDRIYYRIMAAGGTYIATFNTNIKENNTFISFSRHFKSIGAPVPEIYAVNKDASIYIQQDFGNNSLLNTLEQEGQCPHVFELYKKSLRSLAQLQIEGDKTMNYDYCITSKEFGKQAILSDLLYFKYYFIDALKIPYDKERLLDDFDALSNYLSHVEHKYFMFRDFQSRNIMINNDTPFFIDYQGGMKGALQYDVASLLWQAKADLGDEWKNALLEHYMDYIDELLEKPVDRIHFVSQYNGYVLIRLLQVLGAYGFRGLFERKAHFLTSIPLALRNLKWFINNKQFGISLPAFTELLKKIIADDVITQFEPVQANESTPLTISINSFSFLRTGYPKDPSSNGGGFVFDMRGILNPGRFEEYKKLSGLDKPVKDFLEQQTDMPAFLNAVYSLVDISVTDYIKRDFASLMINFGCTGGQHRSVYAAEALARHLRNKFKVSVELNHLNKENWVK